MEDEFDVQVGKYVDVMSDFGFKRTFGEPGSEPVLRAFLNALFEGEWVVDRIVYDNTEKTESFKEQRGLRYDVYCHSVKPGDPDKAEHRFIIEMQRRHQEWFNKRAIFYLASAYTGQVKRGSTYDDDEVVPVIGIFLMDFLFDESDDRERLIQRVGLADYETHRPFSDQINAYFIKLPNLSDRIEDYESEKELWLYYIKNLKTMSSIPHRDKFDGFSALERRVRFAALSEAEQLDYMRALKAESDYDRTIRSGFNMGRKEGKVEGIKESAQKIARNLKNMGMALTDIMSATGLSQSEIAAL